MKHRWPVFIAGLSCLLLLILPSCKAVETAPASTPALQNIQAGELIRYRGDYFSAAGECAFCHTGLHDQNGEDVSIDSAWRASMMANASRDPYYRASVRSEVLAHPHLREVIEEKCAVCHIGMAYTTAEFSGQPTRLLADGGYLNPSHELYPLALDGVSCSLCHQIQPDHLGEMASFSGGYSIDRETRLGEREAYGHFPIDDNMAAVMRNASGYQPLEANHVKRSEICATCHNLFTPYITDDGQISKELFPEQTPHLEWLHSDYTTKASCQDCHMPPAAGAVALANTGSPKREPFPRHNFTGGNLYMLALLSADPQGFSLSAGNEHFDTARQNTLAQLESRTAQLDVRASQDGDTLMIDVSIQALTGHKFPTSFPSRRAWLHLVVKDALGQVIFESGQWQPDGKILYNENDLDENRYEPHYAVITSPEQVQIYEAIIGDPHGNVTTTLLRAKTYLKDNRLLPAGFEKASAGADIAVYGEAREDADFTAGGDAVRYLISVENSTGPYTIDVELLYQSIGYRWAEKFRGEDNPEGIEFYRNADPLGNIPVRIAAYSVVSP